MRRQLSSLHMSWSEGLWVQGDLTNFSGPGSNPQVSYLWRGALPLAGSRGECLQGGRVGGVSQHSDSTLSPHSGDNVIIYPAEATLFL